MRLGILSDESIRIFRSLARPIKYDDNIDGTELFPTRQEVERANMQRMRNLTGESQNFIARDGGSIQDKSQRDRLLANCMAPINIELKKGSQVMLIKNIDETLVNGSLGKVVAFMDEKDFDIYHNNEGDYQAMEEDEPGLSAAKNKLQTINPEFGSDSGGSSRWPLVRFAVADGTSRDLLCQPEIWKIELPSGEVQASRTQIPLILAWALSIHKAQGQTLERVKVDLGRVFEKGQAYVALSRATCQEGLQVLKFNPAKVQAHPRVKTFYQSLYGVDQAEKAAKDAKAAKPAPVKSTKSYEQDFVDDGFDQDAEEAMGYA
jgi:ATP-dependent DNA helicase PIF1